MEEIKIGDYVRTERGFIFKVDTLRKNLIFVKFFDVEYGKIIKHSKNIMQLLKDDDLVEIEYYVAKYRKRIRRIFSITVFEEDTIWFGCSRMDFDFDLANNKWKRNAKGHNPKIVRILTKEQFEQNSYELEEIESKKWRNRC